MAKGAIIEYDFTAVDGAGLLHDTAKKYLAQLDAIPFNSTIEAKYFAGKDYQVGLQNYFNVVKTKKTAVKSAFELAAAFSERLTAVISNSGVASDFVSFVRALEGRGLKVVIVTRANLEAIREQFAGILSDNVTLYAEESMDYGSAKWDSWKRAASSNGLARSDSMAVTGSGFGVKSALLAGLGSLMVTNPHVAYQDCTGADHIINKLDAKSATKVFEILRI